MSVDATEPIGKGRRPKWVLPRIVDIRIRRVPFEAHKLRHFTSALAQYKEAVEFLVRTSGPIPIRALGPALFVGDVQVAESQQVKDNVYRFLAFDLERLSPGAPISWGWVGAPLKERRRTEFRYEESP